MVRSRSTFNKVAARRSAPRAAMLRGLGQRGCPGGAWIDAGREVNPRTLPDPGPAVPRRRGRRRQPHADRRGPHPVHRCVAPAGRRSRRARAQPPHRRHPRADPVHRGVGPPRGRAVGRQAGGPRRLRGLARGGRGAAPLGGGHAADDPGAQGQAPRGTPTRGAGRRGPRPAQAGGAEAETGAGAGGAAGARAGARAGAGARRPPPAAGRRLAASARTATGAPGGTG